MTNPQDQPPIRHNTAPQEADRFYDRLRFIPWATPTFFVVAMIYILASYSVPPWIWLPTLVLLTLACGIADAILNLRPSSDGTSPSRLALAFHALKFLTVQIPITIVGTTSLGFLFYILHYSFYP